MANESEGASPGQERLGGWTGPELDRRTYYVEDRTKYLVGGLGVVYRATATESGESVAVKCFNPDVPTDRFEKLQLRANALKAVQHDNLAQLIDVFVGPPFAQSPTEPADTAERYCVHRWVEGESLAENCVNASPRQILDWCRDLATGLDFLHHHPSGPFAHRDIHPRNVIITTDGSAVLIDFDTVFVEAVSGTFTSALLQGTRFAPVERSAGILGAQKDDRWSLARTILYSLARNPAGDMRLDEARAAATAALSGFAADSHRVVDVLAGVLEGRDPGSAMAMVHRMERAVARHSIIPRPIRRRRREITRVAMACALLAAVASALAIVLPQAPASSPPSLLPTGVTGSTYTLASHWSFTPLWTLTGRLLTETESFPWTSSPSEVAVDVVLPATLVNADSVVPSQGAQLIGGSPGAELTSVSPLRTNDLVYRFEGPLWSGKDCPKSGCTWTLHYRVLLDANVSLARYIADQLTAQTQYLKDAHRSSLLTFLKASQARPRLEIVPNSLSLRVGTEAPVSASLLTPGPRGWTHRAAFGARWSATSPIIRIAEKPSRATATIQGVRVGLSSLTIRDRGQEEFVGIDVLPRLEVPPPSRRTKPPKPAPPSGIVLTAVSSHNAMVSWRQPSTNGEYPVERYTLTGASNCATTTKTSCSIIGFEFGKEYRICVSAITHESPRASSCASFLLLPSQQLDSQWIRGGRTPVHVFLDSSLRQGADDVNATSCSAAGRCVAVGDWLGSGTQQAFISSETPGGWSAPRFVAQGLSNGGTSSVTSVSCPAPGDCTAVGYFIPPNGSWQGFSVAEVDGTWHAAEDLGPFLRDGMLFAVACSLPGNCTAGGQEGETAALISESNGHWSSAETVANQLDPGAEGRVTNVACSSPFNCVAIGYHPTEPSTGYSFVVEEKNGRWATALPLGKPGFRFNSLSCGSLGSCSAGGGLSSGSSSEAIVADESNGRWEFHSIIAGQFAGVNSVSCKGSGDCSAVGSYNLSGVQSSFVATESGGVWQPATEIVGLPSAADSASDLSAISCIAPGDCVTGGNFAFFSNGAQTESFIMIQSNGSWGLPMMVNTGGSYANGDVSDLGIQVVSCDPYGYCAVGGTTGAGLAFVDDKLSDSGR